jgi:hypothetical protein
MHGFDNHLNHVDSGHYLEQYALKRGDLLRIAGGTEPVANLFKGAEDDRRGAARRSSDTTPVGIARRRGGVGR